MIFEIIKKCFTLLFLIAAACYDVTTVGAFTAYAQKYRHGGLRRLLKQMKGTCSESVEGQNKIERINAILNNTNTLRNSIHVYCDGVCRAAVQGDAAELNTLMSVLSDKVGCCGLGFNMLVS